MSYEEEQQELGHNFLDRYFQEYGADDQNGNWNRIEFESTFGCALNCEYCYLNKYEEELEPMEYDMNDIVSHGKMLTDWLVNQGYAPRVDFFGGSPLMFDPNYDLLHYMIDRFSTLEQSNDIVIPSSYVWLGDSEKRGKVRELLKHGERKGVEIRLSASVDGKYCDDNRPTPVLERDEEYYDRVFQFNKKHGFAYHPMIYSEHIEDWEDNWLWYMDKLREHLQQPSRMYLLEVRNPEWSDDQIKEFGEFIQFLLDWTLWHYDIDKNSFMKFILDDGYNILRPFSSAGRGMGCSIQSTVMVQLADLSVKPCHRTTYEEFKLAHFNQENGKITGIDVDNPELMIGHTTAKQETFPMCEDCTIKNLCNGGCLGAQYETSGSLYSPIPTVCELEHEKMYAMWEWFNDKGLKDFLYENITDKFINDFKQLSKAYEGVNNE